MGLRPALPRDPKVGRVIQFGGQGTRPDLGIRKARDETSPAQVGAVGGSPDQDGGTVTDLLARAPGRALRQQAPTARSLRGKPVANPQAGWNGSVASGAGSVELTTIDTVDGTQLSAEVHLPRSVSTRGVVIFVHGFCGDKGENGLFHALAAHCVGLGYAAVLYDWRGIAESDGDFPSSTLHDHTSDFAHVVQWTRCRLNVDAESLHAVGFSLGAAVIGLAMEGQDSLASVTYLSPASRPSRTMWPRYNGDGLWRELEKNGIARKPGSSVFLGPSILKSLRDTDLGANAFALDVPLLVCHGTNDERIHCSHSQELANQRSGGNRFRYVEFPGASHSFRPAEDRWKELGDELTGWLDEASRSNAEKWRQRSGR